MNRYYPEASIHYGFSDDVSYSPSVLGHSVKTFDESQNVNTSIYDATYNHFTYHNKPLRTRGPEFNRHMEHYGEDSSDKYLHDYQERKHGSSICNNKSSGIQECVERAKAKYAKKTNSNSAGRTGLTKMDSDTTSKVQSRYTSRYDDLRPELYNERLSSLQPSRFTETSITQDVTDSNTIDRKYVKSWRQPDRNSTRVNTHMRFTQQMMD